MTCLFLILHAFALFTMPEALFVTVPLHIVAHLIATKREPRG